MHGLGGRTYYNGMEGLYISCIAELDRAGVVLFFVRTFLSADVGTFVSRALNARLFTVLCRHYARGVYIRVVSRVVRSGDMGRLNRV